MVAGHVYLMIWHCKLSAREIVLRMGRPVIEEAEKGDKRGTAGSVFSESYCKLDLGELHVELESEITGKAIEALDLATTETLLKDGGRGWITIVLNSSAYELSVASSEMRKLLVAGIGLSYDISTVWARV